jgi:hypothetical protein
LPLLPISHTHPQLDPTQQQTWDTEAAHDAAPPNPPALCFGVIYVDCHCTTGMIYTEPTGKFLTPSVSGNQYVLIIYEYDGNYMYGAPMPDHIRPSIMSAYKTAIQLFESRASSRSSNASPMMPLALQVFIDEEDINFQLAPPSSITTQCR